MTAAGTAFKQRIARMRETLAPEITSIQTRAEDLLQDAGNQKDVVDLLPDFERVFESARMTFQRLADLTEEGHEDALFEDRSPHEAARFFRHELRNPMGAIKGYAEMLIEDLGDIDAEALAKEVGTLLTDTNLLLTRLDSVVDFSISDTEALKQARRAYLANIQQELLAPASAIIGYGEMVRDQARQLQRDDVAQDCEHIMAAGQELTDAVHRLLAAAEDSNMFDGAKAEDTEARVRIELRTPLTAIVGYAEILTEDLDPTVREALGEDLEHLVTESDRLLSHVDEIIDFSRTSLISQQAATAETVTNLADDIGSRLIDGIGGGGAARVRVKETGRILVVDDLQTVRDLLTRQLTREGHEAVGAVSGAAALNLVNQDAFDLILLDLMMPDMNGFEVLARLKADDRFRETPVIMISAFEEEESAVRCIEAGAEDYLYKPVNPVLLRARIGACMERVRAREREQIYLEHMQEAKDKSENLLLNILPAQIVDRINDGEELIADRFDDVTILFSDLVGFSEISSKLNANELVEDLNLLFSRFDQLAMKNGVEKVKTIGDAYMVVSGLPTPREDHTDACLRMALDMRQALIETNDELSFPFNIRVGIHSGPAVAGIIGTHKFVYDVWGATVNVASRYESYSKPGEIHVSATVAEPLMDQFDFESRGIMQMRSVGEVETYFLKGLRGGGAKTEGGE